MCFDCKEPMVTKEKKPMAKFSPADSGYIEVKDRIEAFWAKYPDGAVRTNVFSIDENLVVMGAEVYAHRNDEHPIGTGFSQMQIPGSTPFTAGSEVENAETSAVGRAIAMAGFEVHKSVASADEIEAKTRPSKSLDKLKKTVREAAERRYGATNWKSELKAEFGVDNRSGEDALNDALAAMSESDEAIAEDEDVEDSF